MAISVINPTETAQDCGLELSGVQAVGAGKVWQITAPPGAAAAAPGGRGGGRGAGVAATMAENTLPQAPGRITLPAASISVYEFPVR